MAGTLQVQYTFWLDYELKRSCGSSKYSLPHLTRLWPNKPLTISLRSVSSVRPPGSQARAPSANLLIRLLNRLLNQGL
jgi:hypothetical protein